MRLSRHILPAVMLLLTVFSCGRRGRVIPAHKFAEIYARMLVADQRVRNSVPLSRMADTMLFYEPILNGFGYSKADYVKSVSRYMEDPESFGEIFKEVKEMLDSRIMELTEEERAIARADSIRKAIEDMPFRRPPSYLHIEWDSVRRDTVSIRPDSSGIYLWNRIMPDTIFCGPAFRLAAGADSISMAAGTDSLDTGTDSIAVDGDLPVPESLISPDTGQSGNAVRRALPVRTHEPEQPVPANVKKFKRVRR